jgi:hypothetical protein
MIEVAAILTAVAAVIGAFTTLASVIAPFVPKKPDPPEPDTREKIHRAVDRFSLIPTGFLNGKNGKAKDGRKKNLPEEKKK